MITFREIYEVRELLKITNKRKKDKQTKRNNSLESIFDVPKLYKQKYKEKNILAEDNSEAKDVKTQFVKEYRQHLRKTIFNKNKSIFKPVGLFFLQSNKSQEIINRDGQRQKNNQSDNLASLYNSIISKPLKAVRNRQLEISPLPIINKIDNKKSKNKIKKTSLETISYISKRPSYNLLQPHQKNRKTKVIGDQNQIEPWETQQQQFPLL